ncbi:glycoside hydrolase family 88 protein [Paenibacillus lautus]|uniref:glycoside hydrolase family 88/105 protein n=1 Tax=Paenibacillus lautus TaxID=1401 RepID=UPI002DB72CCF|nr:glycoside hydrolase family 88 protein [Paenibacillus lautus]MEC0307185.1 glycoside hydrolase family 88 protein [Paenibacillus lautus]
MSLLNDKGYFDSAESLASQTEGSNIEHALTVIAQRYIGENPPHAPVYRVTRKSPIRKRADHCYQLPIADMFPEMTGSQVVYAWTKLWAADPQSFPFLMEWTGHVRLYHNGRKRFGSAPGEEATAGELPLKLGIQLTKGWNHFVLEFRRSPNGCGAVFGTSNRKNKPFHFLAPSMEREGEEGWIVTVPLDGALARIPDSIESESWTGAQWLPVPAKHGGEAEGGPMLRMYGRKPGYAAYAWTAVVNRTLTAKKVTLSGTSYGPVRFEWNGREVYTSREAGTFRIAIDVPPGRGELTARSECIQEGWGFEVSEASPEGMLTAPRRVHGLTGEWLYLGPIRAEAELELSDYFGLDTVAVDGGQTLFWTGSEPGACVRPFLENELFGRWNYPLGVTLYGLLESGRLLNRPDIQEYVLRHVEYAAGHYEYSLWDREEFGAAGLNNQLSDIDSLDDCGSFGALSILADRIRSLKGVRKAADDIARYIMDKQSRLEDGALYREVGVSPSMHLTMWCDDMYMSVPFLCRYAELSGDSRYLDEAARQLLLYKSYLYLPDLQLMSHVYDVRHGQPSRTVWGRGNGWVFFSLSELLAVLPFGHPDYEELLLFYRALAEGYLRVQGVNGLWHQVLTDPESYEEASCTAMFIFGMARGIRHGWLEDPDPYLQSAAAGWEGLTSRAIDRRGNVYGVCKGSSWSTSHAYYKHDLSWNLNDTHGIGIVLLAGVELLGLMRASPIVNA